MSWDAYVTNVITNSHGHCSKASIVGHNGAIWTPAGKPEVINLTQAEASIIGPLMAKRGTEAQSYFQANGIYLEGQKYMFLRDVDGDGKLILGKKVGVGGITLQSTNQAIVIGFTPEGSQQGTTNEAVNGTVKYLSDNNY